MSKNVVATIREDAPFVPAGRYYLFSEPAAWTLMPTDEGSGQLPLTLDKGAYTLTADAAPTEPDEMQGMLRVYKLRPIALTLTDSSGNHAALSVSYGADNLAVLQSWGFDCRSAGEPTDKPAETFTVAVKNGGGLLPKGKLEGSGATAMRCAFSVGTRVSTRARAACRWVSCRFVRFAR